MARGFSRQAFNMLLASLWAALPNALFGQFDRLPYLQSLTESAVLIVSQSQKFALVRLEWGTTPALGTVLAEDFPANDHVFKLEGLQPQTRYYYQMTHDGAAPLPVASFRTLPGPDGEVSLAVIGDSGVGSKNQREIAELLKALKPDLLLHTGDMAYPAGFPETYQSFFFNIYGDLLSSTCVYPVLGNHDCARDPIYWLDIFHLPANNPAGDESYYSFDAGAAHFVSINSCDYSVPEEEVLWLEEDLSRTQQTWKIVYLHHTIYSNSAHGPSGLVRAQLLPALERQHVDLVFTGHDHTYERSLPIRGGFSRDAFQDPEFFYPDGTMYVVSGGGGAPLYPYIPSADAHMSAVFHSKHHYTSLRISPTRIEGSAIDVDNNLIDRFSIRKEGRKPDYRFIRGDADEDGLITLADPIAVLFYMFRGARPPCLAAADTDGSGELLLDDVISVLTYMFLGGLPPAAPFPNCDVSPKDATAGCRKNC